MANEAAPEKYDEVKFDRAWIVIRGSSADEVKKQVFKLAA